MFQVDDIDSAAHMLKELRDSNKTLETFGKNSKRVFEEYFVLKRMINKLKEVYSYTM